MCFKSSFISPYVSLAMLKMTRHADRLLGLLLFSGVLVILYLFTFVNNEDKTRTHLTNINLVIQQANIIKENRTTTLEPTNLALTSMMMGSTLIPNKTDDVEVRVERMKNSTKASLTSSTFAPNYKTGDVEVRVLRTKYSTKTLMPSSNFASNYNKTGDVEVRVVRTKNSTKASMISSPFAPNYNKTGDVEVRVARTKNSTNTLMTSSTFAPNYNKTDDVEVRVLRTKYSTKTSMTSSTLAPNNNKNGDVEVRVARPKYSTKTSMMTSTLGHNNNKTDDVEVRVLCFVLTTPSNYDLKARHVKETWGKRCNYYFFVSSTINDTLPTISLPVNESREILWGKTKLGFTYAFEHFYDKADWFMKADDDTYVIVENLRHMLKDYNSSEPIWFGCKYKPHVKSGYMSGGAGYVLSKEALRKFVTVALKDETGETCRTKDNGGFEDVEIGKCLESLNVTAGDSRDFFGRHRFFGLSPSHIIPKGSKNPNFWYWQYQFYPFEDGNNCCSNSTIAFHYVSPNEMLIFDFFIYKLKVFKSS